MVQMAKENPTWGYDRIVGALANLGQRLSDQTVGNILRRHGVPPAPKRKHTVSWRDFIRPSPPSSVHPANHGVTAPGHIQMTSHDPMNVSPFTFPRLVARAPSPSDTTEQLFAGAMHCC